MAEYRPRDDSPQVPDIDRRVSLSPGRITGVFLLMLLPVLALLGQLDESRRSGEASSAALLLRVDYPRQVRADEEMEIRAAVTRTGGVSSGVLLRLEGDYLEAMELLGTEPPPRSLGEILWEEIAPGETREARLRVRARAMGPARGAVRASAPGEELRVELRTRILP